MDDNNAREVEALHKNQTWKLVPLLLRRKAIGNKWVYNIKRYNNDQVERYCARLIVKGYVQKENINFNEIFSPIFWLTSIWVALSMCARFARFDLHFKQLDVKTMFLHGELEEEIYMLKLEGFKENGKENLVYRLTKSVYNQMLV